MKMTTINKKMTLTETLKNIYRTNGIYGFYNGGVTTILRQATTQGTSFVVFDKSKVLYNNIDYISSYSGVFAGMTSGIVAVLINNPIDVIKTYKQSDRGNESMISIGKEIIQKRGVYGFYNGALMRIVRIAPLYGITFFMHDWFHTNQN
jgi:hypothetical protein